MLRHCNVHSRQVEIPTCWKIIENCPWELGRNMPLRGSPEKASLLFFFFFKQVGAPAAHGSSQARGRATATAEATPSSYVVSPTASPTS